MIWATLGMIVFAAALWFGMNAVEAEDVKRVERLRRKRTRP